MLKKIFGIDSSFTNIMGKFADIILVSMLWIVCSIPMITIVTSTAALYYSLVKGVRKDRGTPSKEFFRFFKENWKKGLVLGGIYIGFGALTVGNFLSVMQMDRSLSIYWVYQMIAVCVGIIFIFLSLFLFPVFSRFEYKAWDCVKASLFIAFRHPISIMVMAVFMIAVFVISLRYPILFLCVPETAFLLCSVRIEKILKKYMQEPKEGELIPWYWEDGKSFVQDDEEK